MQRGFTNKRPVQILKGSANIGTDPIDTRQVLVFNNSGVSLWLGDDENSATSVNGVPVLAGTLATFLWPSDLWIGADIDSTEFRYLVSPHFIPPATGSTSTWEELGRQTPKPPVYVNRPAGH